MYVALLRFLVVVFRETIEGSRQKKHARESNMYIYAVLKLNFFLVVNPFSEQKSLLFI